VSEQSAAGRLFGVGVGPGDPDLVTVRAARLIGEADVVAYHCARHGHSVARAAAVVASRYSGPGPTADPPFARPGLVVAAGVAAAGVAVTVGVIELLIKAVGADHCLFGTEKPGTGSVKDPETGLTVWKRLQLRRLAEQSEPGASRESGGDRQELRQRADLRISALGSGSDYTAFLDHLGIASLNIGYGGEDDGGIYHSVYDDFNWYTHFSDTDFSYGRALAETIGLAVLRLADADILPFDFSDFTDTVQRYVDEIRFQVLGRTKPAEPAAYDHNSPRTAH